jgi:LacI family repressor for deo operon, udp, cdd, tsx, nupC, and nupG
MNNPFFAQLCDRIAASLGTQGLLGVVASAPVGGIQEDEYVAGMVDLGIAGSVFVAASNTLLEANPRLTGCSPHAVFRSCASTVPSPMRTHRC